MIRPSLSSSQLFQTKPQPLLIGSSQKISTKAEQKLFTRSGYQSFPHNPFKPTPKKTLIFPQKKIFTTTEKKPETIFDYQPKFRFKTQQKGMKRTLSELKLLQETSCIKQTKKQKILKRILITKMDRMQGENRMFQKYCQIFQLEWKPESDINKVLKSLRQKYREMTFEYHKNQNLRKSINEAYELLSQKIFGIKYSQEEQKLILAIIHQDINQVNKIFTQNPKMINFRLKGTNYPLLYFAVRTGSYQISEFILSKISQFDFSSDRSTPMHCAAYYGYSDLIGLLVQHGIPVNIKNKFGNLPIEQTKSQKIEYLIINAKRDHIHQFITKLSDQGLCLKTFNIQDKFQVIAKKIILKSNLKNYDNYVDTFHGTPFENFYSIAKFGLKKPGQKAGDKVVSIPKGHIQDQKWANNVFVSPSIFYSGSPVYSRQIQFLNTIKNKTDKWLPILQVKVKKGCYKESKSTTSSHKPLKGQPQYVEYIIGYNNEDEARQKFCVVALIFVKAWYLKSKKVYHEANQIMLNGVEEKMWRASLNRT